MTTQELRELDEWIAEHVMEYRWWFDVLALECMLCRPDETWPERKGFKLHDGKPFGAKDFSDLSLFKPTTDPAAAMMVLEKCISGAGRSAFLTKTSDGWIVGFATGKSLSAFAETLPLAICLFAKQLFSKP